MYETRLYHHLSRGETVNLFDVTEMFKLKEDLYSHIVSSVSGVDGGRVAAVNRS